MYSSKHKLDGDTSIMTYKGHVVIKTLVRSRFSPMETTGQRYIYTGCGVGRVVSKWFCFFKLNCWIESQFNYSLWYSYGENQAWAQRSHRLCSWRCLASIQERNYEFIGKYCGVLFKIILLHAIIALYSGME